MALQSNYTTEHELTKAPSERNECLSILHPNETHVIMICTIVLLFFVFAALGDGMFISAFAKDVRMRTTTNMLVISHLTAEFASSILGIATHVSILVVHGQMFDQTAWCITTSSIFNSSMSVGFLSLVGISIDRYLAVVKKVHHKMTRTRVQIFLVIVIWTLSVVYGIPWDLIFNGRLRWQYVAWLLVNCEASFLANKDLRTWTLADILRGLLLFFGIFLPLVIMTFASFHILRAALKSRQRVHAIGRISNHIAAAYSRSAFTTLLIIGTYFLCLIPSLVLTGICENSSNCSMALYFFAKITLCFRSACYPVIYAARNQNYSRYFRQFLRRRKIKICTCCFTRNEHQLNGERTSQITVSRISGCVERAVHHHTCQDAPANHKPKLAFVDLREISSENEGVDNHCMKRI